MKTRRGFSTFVLATVVGGCLAGALARPLVLQGQSTSSSSNHAPASDKSSATQQIAAVPARQPENETLPARSDYPQKSIAQQKPEGGAETPTDAYTIGIADELQISVWKEPDLSGPVVVRPDGMITIAVVGDVQVIGQTTKQVQDLLTEKLKPVVNEPQVTVIVRNIHSRKVYLVGQVGRPGSIALTGHETVLQVIAESGGLSLYAKPDKIYVLRKVGEKQERLNFSYKKAIKGSDPKDDFALVNGDVIVVP